MKDVNPQSKPTKLDDELLRALDPEGELGLGYCTGMGRCWDKGAIFDPGYGEYGNHILTSEQVLALHKYVESKVLEGRVKNIIESQLVALARAKEMGIDKMIEIYKAQLEATPTNKLKGGRDE